MSLPPAGRRLPADPRPSGNADATRSEALLSVLFIVGVLQTVLAAAMLVPAAVDLAFGSDDWHAFLVSAAMVGFLGVGLMLSGRPRQIALGIREAFLVTAASWVSLSLSASLPLHFSVYELDIADAVFEAVSGLTTTGSTVLVGLDAAPPGLLLWRSMLEWLGGIGIIVMAIAILPFLRVGGMQLFRTESSDRSDKVTPRLGQMVGWIAGIYLGLTAACTLSLLAAGLSPFDAVNHAMTTVSTGGFSTKDASIGHYASPAVEWIAVVFMLSGALPFLRYVAVAKGRGGLMLGDSQVRTFLAVVGVLVLVLAAWFAATGRAAPGEALRAAAFNLVSVITTTGFASTDYTLWGPFAVALFLAVTVIGGCSGSTSGGLKIFRFQILWIALVSMMRRLYQPHRVIVPTYQGKPVEDRDLIGVMAFAFVFIGSLMVTTVLLAALGLDLVTALSASATALANVGPGLGEIIGPAGNFAPLPDAAKWLLCFAMLLGRLEFFTLLVLVLPGFWRS